MARFQRKIDDPHSSYLVHDYAHDLYQFCSLSMILSTIGISSVRSIRCKRISKSFIFIYLPKMACSDIDSSPRICNPLTPLGEKSPVFELAQRSVAFNILRALSDMGEIGCLDFSDIFCLQSQNSYGFTCQRGKFNHTLPAIVI